MPRRLGSSPVAPRAVKRGLAWGLRWLAPSLALPAFGATSLAAAPGQDPSRTASLVPFATLVAPPSPTAPGGTTSPVSPSPTGSSNPDQARGTAGGPPGDGSLLIVAGDGFAGWHSLNDTIMGGRSQGQCQSGSTGLVMAAEVVAEGGGFVSCRSPLFSPPLDLSAQAGLQLEIEADGRRYKLAIACSDGLAGLTELIPGGLRWVAEFDTAAQGLTQVWIPFSQLRASVRAKPVGLPLRFDPCRITRLQILHSRFGDDGGVNNGFRAGPLQLRIQAIRALP